VSLSRALLSISFGAFPPGSPHIAPSERDAPFLEPSFIHLSTSPVYEPPSRFPSRAPMGRDAVSRAFIYTSSRVPTKGAPPSRFPSQSSLRERRCTSRAPFIHLSKSLVNEPPLLVPQWRSYGERCPSPEPCLHNLQGPQ